MKTTAKKWVSKKRRSPAKAAKTKPLARKVPSAGEDAAERKKIGKTLDMTAFMEEYRNNTSAAAYWAQEE